MTDTAATATNLGRLRDFVISLSALVETSRDESEIIHSGSRLLAGLVSFDDWLPEQYADSNSNVFTQYLLHADSREHFSIISFVLGPGQKTPIHDHTVWGLVGVLRGAENAQNYSRAQDGRFTVDGPLALLESGMVTAVSPAIGDFHQISNAHDDRASVSIHVYGANIGSIERSVYNLDGSRKHFISGYSNAELPNLWDRSKSKK
jgi:predicted metal-dependent enzyme (double-stranded beta helix superfamily)